MHARKAHNAPHWPSACPHRDAWTCLLTPQMGQFLHPPPGRFPRGGGAEALPVNLPFVAPSRPARWHSEPRVEMSTFSCNVPQIALTFGKSPTSGPIRLQTFFLEKERDAREGTACSVLKGSCFPAQTPGAATLSLSSRRPRGLGRPSALPGGGGVGRRNGNPQGRDKVPDHTASLHRRPPGSRSTPSGAEGSLPTTGRAPTKCQALF